MSTSLAAATAGTVVAGSAAELAAVAESPRLEAELIVAGIAGLERAALIARPELGLSADEARHIARAVARRRHGEPLAYILGSKEFYSLQLSVGEAVLVPRPETECVVDAALVRLSRIGARVLDLGTGAGAIALAIKHARPDVAVTAVDCSGAALEVARANGVALGLDIDWRLSNWFDAVAGKCFDLIVSNPPYVASDDPHFDSGLVHEPRIALDGGPDGLNAYRAIFAAAAGHLESDAEIIVEHGYDQRSAVIELAHARGFRCTAAIDDLSGHPRVAVLARGGV